MEAPGRLGGQNYSPWVTVFNMCNAAIGSGVLSFPFAFRQTGVVGGLILTITIWSIEVAVLCMLIRAAEKYKTKSYQVSVSLRDAGLLMQTCTHSKLFAQQGCECNVCLQLTVESLVVEPHFRS